MEEVNERNFTVRNIPAKIAAALHAERKRRGASLNQTVIDLLSHALGVQSPGRNELAKFAGTWSEAQFREFESATAVFEKVDRGGN